MIRAIKTNARGITTGRSVSHPIVPYEDSGQAFVELALVLPLLTLILVGAAEFGRFAYAAVEVSNAARAGVAYASQSHTYASDNSGIAQAAANEAPDVTTLAVQNPATLSCSCEDSTGKTTAFSSCSSTVTNTTSCPSPSRIVEYVTVNTSAQVPTMFNFPGIAGVYTMQGQATMRVGQ